jgi:hypothetical protein
LKFDWNIGERQRNKIKLKKKLEKLMEEKGKVEEQIKN